MRQPVTLGLVGLNGVGGQLTRTLLDLPDAELRWLCDPTEETALRARRQYPTVRFTTDVADLLDDEELDAVAIACPPALHYELAHAALEADKHVLVEAPVTLDGAQADLLAQEAQQRGRRLVVSELLLFHPAVRRLKELVAGGGLGDIYYLFGQRLAGADPSGGENPLWILGSETLSLLFYLLDDEPLQVVATGDAFVEPGIVDVLFGHFLFATGIRAHLHLSSLGEPRARRLLVAGAAGATVFDDRHVDFPLTVFEPGGDAVRPGLGSADPCRLACQHFISVVRAPTESNADAKRGAAVVHAIEALRRSLERGGSVEPLREEGGEVIRLPIAHPNDDADADQLP